MAPVNVLCVIYDLVWFPRNFFQLQWKIKIIHFLVFEFFCMIPVWFLGNHIWSLYDYQEFIQIIYDLVWLLRIIYDLVRNQRKLYDHWPGECWNLIRNALKSAENSKSSALFFRSEARTMMILSNLSINPLRYWELKCFPFNLNLW